MKDNNIKDMKIQKYIKKIDKYINKSQIKNTKLSITHKDVMGIQYFCSFEFNEFKQLWNCPSCSCYQNALERKCQYFRQCLMTWISVSV